MVSVALVDAGPLIASIDKRDPWHASVVGFFVEFKGALLTTWPVVTEVCHLTSRQGATRFMRSIARGGIEVRDIPQNATAQIADLMDKYADLPMDLADASLVWLADEVGVRDVITLDDRDFSIYRLAGGRKFNNLMATMRR